MNVKLKPLLKGMLTLVPGLDRILPQHKVGSTDLPEHCYFVWLKHLTMLYGKGINTIPDTFAELGPGESLGVGFAAMLSGANKYYAMDVKEYSNTPMNLKIFDELVKLFKARSPRPKQGWPNFDEYLDENLFPSKILTEEILAVSLSDERIQRIRSAIENLGVQQGELLVKYMAPWTDSSIIKKDSVDLILSHSVLEHVVDLEHTYQALYTWLKPNGIMTHQIDLSSHTITEKWNGHRAISEFLWKLVAGNRPWLLNRQPCSVHIELLKKNNFKIIGHLNRYNTDGIKRSELAPRWQTISDDDLNCDLTFIQAQK